MKVIKIIRKLHQKILNYLNIDERKLEEIHQKVKKILSGMIKTIWRKI